MWSALPWLGSEGMKQPTTSCVTRTTQDAERGKEARAGSRLRNGPESSKPALHGISRGLTGLA